MTDLITLFSCPGAFHLSNGEKNQDAIARADGKRYAVIVLADGVSQCKKAYDGAQIAANTVSQLMQEQAENFFSLPHKQAAEIIFESVLIRLQEKANADNEPEEEYSSTIATVLYDKEKNRLFFCNLGDGLIIVTGNSKYGILAPPSINGNGCNTTTTLHAQFTMQTGVVDCADIENVMVCSDGVWKKIFDRNRIKSELKNSIIQGNTDEIHRYLDNTECFDDYSLAMMKVRNEV